jgi:uncharacterized protein (DUF952 family)
MEPIYHIALVADWERAEATGAYRHPSLEREGYVHCSAAHQVAGVADVWFAGQRGLVLLEIDPGRAGAEVRWEDGGAGELFPHVYGPIPLEAVLRTFGFAPDAEGRFALPGEIDS